MALYLCIVAKESAGRWGISIMRLMSRAILATCLVFWGGSFAHAQESTTYNYDALGRLSGVAHSGGPNNGVAVSYAFDPASNRTNYTSAVDAILNIAGASANEGTALVFTVTRSGITSSAVTVNYATSNGTAIAGTNYTTTSGMLSFAANVTTQTITVPTIDDHLVKPSLVMVVTLSSPSSGAAVGATSATGTINNID